MIDADCIVAGTIANSGAAARLLELWRAGHFELIACRQLVEEVRQALLRPRIAGHYGITSGEVDDLCRRIQEESIWFPDPVDPPRAVAKDANDDYLVAHAVDGRVDALVTRDRHFDDLRVSGLRIVFPGVLLTELGEAHAGEP